jgi:hypothetical protein
MRRKLVTKRRHSREGGNPSMNRLRQKPKVGWMPAQDRHDARMTQTLNS